MIAGNVFPFWRNYVGYEDREEEVFGRLRIDRSCPCCGDGPFGAHAREAVRSAPEVGAVAPRKSSSPKKSARYYAANPEAAKKKKAYDTKYHSTPARKKYRAELDKARRKAGVNGKGGKDMSHRKGGGFTREAPSKNRARNGSAGRSTKR